SFYSGCCGLFVPYDLTAFMTHHAAAPLAIPGVLARRKGHGSHYKNWTRTKDHDSAPPPSLLLLFRFNKRGADMHAATVFSDPSYPSPTVLPFPSSLRSPKPLEITRPQVLEII
ncbi:hypothetical protein B296_00049222, partial [Ensete ventricosum]